MGLDNSWIEQVQRADTICSACFAPWERNKTWHYLFDGLSVAWKHKCGGFGVPRKQLIFEHQRGQHKWFDEIKVVCEACNQPIRFADLQWRKKDEEWEHRCNNSSEYFKGITK